MAALQITITDAGRAEIINAANTGTAPVEITEVGLGTGQYTPNPAQTALTSEVKRLNTISGEVVADDTIHVTVKDEGGDAYDVAEFGLFTASGTLFAVYSQASGPFMQKAAQSSLLLSVDVILGTLDATNLTFGDTSFSNPPASETVAGVVELATNPEARAGTDTQCAVTPKGVMEAITQFGLGDQFSVGLGQNYDLNTVPAKTAFYSGYQPVNGPDAVGNNIYTLEVYSYSTGWITQRLNMMTASTVRVFERCWQNNVGWTGWIETQNSGNNFIAGAVQAFAANSAPAGWLKANGAAISRTSYADLFARIGTTFGAGDGSTTFNLPDLRGEFVRGWDDGRGIDGGRAFGGYQEGTHITADNGTAPAIHGIYDSSQINADTSDGGSRTFIHTSTGATLQTDSSFWFRVRPRNVALLYCIKY